MNNMRPEEKEIVWTWKYTLLVIILAGIMMLTAFIIVWELEEAMIIGKTEEGICYSPLAIDDCCYRRCVWPTFGGATYDLTECESGYTYESISGIREIVKNDW